MRLEVAGEMEAGKRTATAERGTINLQRTLTTNPTQTKRREEMARAGSPATTSTPSETATREEETTTTSQTLTLHLEEADVVKELRATDSAMEILGVVEDRTRKKRTGRATATTMTRSVITKTCLRLEETRCLTVGEGFHQLKPEMDREETEKMPTETMKTPEVSRRPS